MPPRTPTALVLWCYGNGFSHFYNIEIGYIRVNPEIQLSVYQGTWSGRLEDYAPHLDYSARLWHRHGSLLATITVPVSEDWLAPRTYIKLTVPWSDNLVRADNIIRLYTAVANDETWNPDPLLDYYAGQVSTIVEMWEGLECGRIWAELQVP